MKSAKAFVGDAFAEVLTEDDMGYGQRRKK